MWQKACHWLQGANLHLSLFCVEKDVINFNLLIVLCHKNRVINFWDYLMFLTFTVYPKKYAHGFCFAVLCCGYTLTDFPISIRLTSLALWQSNDCPSASKATLMNMDKYFMWIHYERLHNHNKAKPNKTVCIFLGIYCNKRLGILSTRQGNVSSMWWHKLPIWLTWKLKTKMNNQIWKWDPVCN